MLRRATFAPDEGESVNTLIADPPPDTILNRPSTSRFGSSPTI
jgi:hypothetical protein